MAYDLENDLDRADAAATEPSAPSEAFRVSVEPVVAQGHARRSSGSEKELPRSYGAETLWLLPRDPQSLFAYWDIDWPAAFGQKVPRARKVHLRLLAPDGSEQTSLEVEPLAGTCAITVPEADAKYYGEIGFFDAEGVWNEVRRSEMVSIPPKAEGAGGSAEFATIPLHVSFQRMIDATRAAEKKASLTSALADLREQASDEGTTGLTETQRELAGTIAEAAARQPNAAVPSAAAPDLWVRHSLERILGFGNSSVSGGFGGGNSSRAR